MSEASGKDDADTKQMAFRKPSATEPRHVRRRPLWRTMSKALELSRCFCKIFSFPVTSCSRSLRIGGFPESPIPLN